MDPLRIVVAGSTEDRLLWHDSLEIPDGWRREFPDHASGEGRYHIRRSAGNSGPEPTERSEHDAGVSARETE